MFIIAILGFLIPSASLALFPFLPFVLFLLMTLTLLGMKQNLLVVRLKTLSVWRYALLHAFLTMGIVALLAQLLDFDHDLILAVVGVAATGSLFATPAIVRALGFDSLAAMAMTIASTLMLPVSIVVALLLFQEGQIELDLVTYFMRLVIFIFGPMLFSFAVHACCAEDKLQQFLVKISPYTILLVFAFPFGLVGSFRVLYDTDPWKALQYFLIAIALCTIFFTLAYCVYRRQGKAVALTAALTSANRNVLLTYSIAGGLLGPAFLPMVGALQIPTSVLPVVVRWLNKVLK